MKKWIENIFDRNFREMQREQTDRQMDRQRKIARRTDTQSQATKNDTLGEVKRTGEGRE